jgi:hypothetical protein
VLCCSEQRIAKDRAIRAKQEGRLRADIDKLTRRVADGKLVEAAKINQAIGRLQERYPRVARYFGIEQDPQTATIVCEFDAAEHAKDASINNCYDEFGWLLVDCTLWVRQKSGTDHDAGSEAFCATGSGPGC